MLDKQLLHDTVTDFLKDTSVFPVEISIKPDNNITVTVDSADGVDIDLCVALTRRIEQVFDRDAEDYELEVGSAGITAPFTVPQQYFINVGNPVEILTADSRKLRGTLVEVNPECTEITVEVPTKVKLPERKRPVVENVPQVLAVKDIRRITRHLEF